MKNTMNTNSNIQNGLDILRREARGTQACGCEKDRTYKRIMQAAERHVNTCGGDWFAIKDKFSEEIADLLGI